MRNTRFVAAATLALLAVTAVPAAAATRDAVMPGVVGKTVWDAEKAVPVGTHIVFVDGTGQHRKVLWPANWRVCKQDPAAGTALTSSTTVTLTVVKKEEKC
jgi:beta-lactam-binding protein with PASTA domain